MVEVIDNCRVAVADDAAGIFRVLAEVAPEIPVLIDTCERRNGVSRIIDNCVATGESWVAIDSNNRISGFLLVEPDQIERFQRGNQALHLSYAGVTKSQRKQGVFVALVRLVMSRNVPLTATVKAANQSGMAAILKRSGFQEWGANSRLEEAYLRWQPAT